MALGFEYLQGKAKWAKLVTPDTMYSCWGLQLYLNQESYEKFLKLKEPKGDIQGILNVIKKDDDGCYVSLRRPTSKLVKGKVVGFNPPEVLDGNNLGPDGVPLPLRNALLGNGSDVTCKIEVYTYKKPGHNAGRGTAIRLSSVRVDVLVPFETGRDFDDRQEKSIRGLSEQPEQLF